MMNPASLIKIKSMWNRFTQDHPRFPMFLNAAQGMVMEDSVIDIKITAPDGRTITTNMKLTESDMELFEELKNLR